MAHPIIASQDALKAILTARGAWADVVVADGMPTEDDDVRWDLFWFNDTQIPRDGWAFIGGAMRQISFNLGFTIAVYKSGDDEHAARLRALNLFDDFMAAIKANPTLTSTVQQTFDVTGTFASSPISPAIWGGMFTGTLACTSNFY
jgi:hypothetical protein